MKFSCSTKDIASAVGAASKVVNAHTTVPILSNVLLTASDNSIRVRATDLELTLEQIFPAEISEPGSVTVPAKLFSGYLGNLPAGIMELAGTPTRASVKWERSNYDFHALPPDEYPPLPSSQKGTSFAIDGRTLRDGVNASPNQASSARGPRVQASRASVAAIEATVGDCLEENGYPLSLPATERRASLRLSPRLSMMRSMYPAFLGGKLWLKLHTPVGRFANISALELAEDPPTLPGRPVSEKSS